MASAADPASGAGATRPASPTSAASEPSAPSLVPVRSAGVPAAPRPLSPMRSRYERSFGSTEIYPEGARKLSIGGTRHDARDESHLWDIPRRRAHHRAHNRAHDRTRHGGKVVTSVPALEIARQASLLPIVEVAGQMGL